MLSNIEKGFFINLFNRGGCVLNFTTADFDSFTLQSVGVPLCSHYGLSKGKSLIAYTDEADVLESQKLLFDLLEYYEAYYRPEFDPEASDDFSNYLHEKGNAALYAKCADIRGRESASPISGQVEYIQSRFTSTYLKQQTESLIYLRTANPTEAIGKSKELIESCCKTILEAYDIKIDPYWDVAKLSKETARALKLSGKDSTEDPAVLKIMGGLQSISSGIAEFRNRYGSGHGKSDSFVPLPPRHAKLAVGSALTLVEYYWEVFEWRQATNPPQKKTG